MILPDKNIKLEYSLLNCGALILSEITESQTISSLWDKSKKHEMLVSYEKLMLFWLIEMSKIRLKESTPEMEQESLL